MVRAGLTEKGTCGQTRDTSEGVSQGESWEQSYKLGEQPMLTQGRNMNQHSDGASVRGGDR